MDILSRGAVWFVRHQEVSRPRVRLFCFHHAGGGASFCRNWPRYLPPDVELLAVQLPGREQRFREPRFTRLEPVVETLLPLIRPRLDLPYVFFGHSMGVLISFELALRLANTAHSRPILFVSSGRSAPHVPRTDPLTHHLPDREFCTEILRQSYTEKLESVINDPELRAVFLPQLRADLSLCETYVYLDSPPLDCPIVAFAGTDESGIADEHLSGWASHTTQSATWYRFPGGHFFIESGEAAVVRTIAAEIATTLAAKPRRSGS
jgi:medium-chain acyl-[acyl-carrier-protein] hydrolase